VITFPSDQAAEQVTVQVSVPGAPAQRVSLWVTPGSEQALRQPALRGRVLNAAGGPVAGATITVAGRPGATRSDYEGAWIYCFNLDQPTAQVRLTATLPDGRQLTQHNVPVEPGATSVVPPFRVP